VGLASQVLAPFEFRLCQHVKEDDARGIRCPKSVEAKLGHRSATCMADLPGFGELPPQINGGAHSLHL
jgi:hypothetical protein